MGYREATTASATTTAATLSGVTASTETTNQGKNHNFSQFFMIFLSATKMALNAPDGGLTLQAGPRPTNPMATAPVEPQNYVAVVSPKRCFSNEIYRLFQIPLLKHASASYDVAKIINQFIENQ